MCGQYVGEPLSKAVLRVRRHWVRPQVNRLQRLAQRPGTHYAHHLPVHLRINAGQAAATEVIQIQMSTDTPFLVQIFL